MLVVDDEPMVREVVARYLSSTACVVERGRRRHGGRGVAGGATVPISSCSTSCFRAPTG